MQGLTNRALRRLFIENYKPDIVFTEFLRVRPGAKKRLSKVDCAEIKGHGGASTLVVQLIGRKPRDLVIAALEAQEMGAVHINLNMGCPFGRMASNSAGGALMKDTSELPEILAQLRKNIQGSFSIKLRSGYSDHRQIFDLLPLFADHGVDFLVLHPRTVTQKYSGRAQHQITAEVVASTTMSVIANGDMRTASQCREILMTTKAAGLMMGRGAIADPWLFERVRGNRPESIKASERINEIQNYLRPLLELYKELFCGEVQVLNKIKSVTRHFDDEALQKGIKKLQRTGNLKSFSRVLENLVPD